MRFDIRFQLFMIVMTATIPGAAWAQTLSYVTNFDSADVTLIDTSDNTVLATVSVGTRPRNVAVAPNGAFAYVVNQGDHTVSVINASTQSVIRTVPVGSDPFGVAVSPDGAFVYVSNSFSNDISVIDTHTNSVVATIPVGFNPWDVVVSPDGAFAYTANSNSDDVSVIDLSLNAEIATVAAGNGPFLEASPVFERPMEDFLAPKHSQIALQTSFEVLNANPSWPFPSMRMMPPRPRVRDSSIRIVCCAASEGPTDVIASTAPCARTTRMIPSPQPVEDAAPRRSSA